MMDFATVEKGKIMADEKRLIDANTLIKEAYAEGAYGYVDAKQIADAPTVDAAPVVRCWECEHWKPFGSKAGNSFLDMEYIGCCEFTNYCRSESDFCSYGKRKEGDRNG